MTFVDYRLINKKLLIFRETNVTGKVITNVTQLVFDWSYLEFYLGHISSKT